MERVVFAGPAQVEIQGDAVLELIAFNQDKADYRVIGFEKPTITIQDHRCASLVALEKVLNSGKPEDFPSKFNRPSYITVTENDNTAILVKLENTPESTPDHMLWIAIGIDEYIPVYDYVFDQIAPLDDKHFAFLGLYHFAPPLESAALSTVLAVA